MCVDRIDILPVQNISHDDKIIGRCFVMSQKEKIWLQAFFIGLLAIGALLQQQC